MRHSIDENNGKLHVKYSWKRGAMWESLSMDAKGDPQEVQPGSQEEFIAEHYWGYTPRGEITSEFAVEHPKWRIWLGTRAALDCDVEALYGSHFVECLCTPPSSAFIAEGSKVVVRFGGTIERGA